MGIEPELVEPVPGDEAAHLKHFVLELALDRREGDHRRLVAGRLEDAAEQARGDEEPGPGPLEDRRQGAIGEIGVRAAEVEYELDCRAHHHGSFHGRKSISKVQAPRFWLCSHT
jgi:hypothetical protein